MAASKGRVVERRLSLGLGVSRREPSSFSELDLNSPDF